MVNAILVGLNVVDGDSRCIYANMSVSISGLYWTLTKRFALVLTCVWYGVTIAKREI